MNSALGLYLAALDESYEFEFIEESKLGHPKALGLRTPILASFVAHRI